MPRCFPERRCKGSISLPTTDFDNKGVSVIADNQPIIPLFERLTQLRKSRGMTQVQLAKHIGVKQETVSGYERGKERPGIITVVKLSEVLGASTDYLLGITDEEHPKPKLSDLLNPRELEVIETFRTLPYPLRERVIGYLHSIAENAKQP